MFNGFTTSAARFHLNSWRTVPPFEPELWYTEPEAKTKRIVSVHTTSPDKNWFENIMHI